MARRAAVKHSPESKKEQNRINQRAFRKRQRKEIEDMRAQFANYEASQSHNPGPQPHETKTDHDIRELSPTLPEPWEIIQPTVAPDPLSKLSTHSSVGPRIDNGVEAAASDLVDPGVICNAMATGHGAPSEGQSEISHDLQPSSGSSVHSQNQSLQMGGSAYPQMSFSNQPGDVSLTVPAGLIENPVYNPPSVNALDPLAGITSDFVNVQHSALRSAGWYAKAAEVGIAVAKIRYNAWLASSSFWPQSSLSDKVTDSMSSAVGVAGPGNFANDLPSAASISQSLDFLDPGNQSMSHVWQSGLQSIGNWPRSSG